MKVFAIITAFTFAIMVSAKECCNYTNGGKCMNYCPGKGFAPAAEWARYRGNILAAATEAVEVKADAV